MSFVLVVDKNRNPLNPSHPAQARVLLDQGKAAVLRRFPFTIILEGDYLQAEPLRLKIDSGSKTTGLAIINDKTGLVVFAAELNHRGETVHQSLTSRTAFRRSRRQRKTRYRESRFDNRKRDDGWLAPSLQSRVDNIITWVKRLIHFCPIQAISIESVKFDMQRMQNPEISSVEYQQGELFGYEVREYLLEKFRRICVYCKVTNVPLEIEHIVPKSRGGTNKISNLVLACTKCNIKKGNKTAEEFGHPHVQKLASMPLRDAAAVNTTRKQVYEKLLLLGLPVETGTGGRTKYNRSKLNLPKSHWLDAACVGASTPQKLTINFINPMIITAIGYGSRNMCKPDKYGFPRSSAKKAKKIFGFQTGDMISANVREGKKKGYYTGKVAIRTNGYFNITTAQKVIQGIRSVCCKVIQACDGYRYTNGAFFTPN